MPQPAPKFDDGGDEHFQPHLKAIPGQGQSTGRSRSHLRPVEQDDTDADEGLSGIDGGGESTPRSKDHLHAVKDQDDGEDEDKAAKDERAKLDDQVGQGYTGGQEEKQPQKAQGFRARRRQIAAAMAGITAAGALGFGIVQAPNMIMNHLREVLLGKASQLQTHQTTRYRRKYTTRIGDMFSRDGRRGRKIIQDMERRGYKFSFDGDTGNMKGIKTPAGIDIPEGQVAEHLEGYIEVRHPLRTSRWKTARMEAFYSRFGVSRKGNIGRVDGDPEDPERAVNKKNAEDVMGDEEPETTVKGHAEGDGDETPEEAAAREQRNAADDALARSDGSLDKLKQKLRDGTPLSELSEEERVLLRASSRVDDEVVKLIEDLADGGTVAGTAFNGIKGVAVGTDLLDKICIVKNRLAAVVVAARNARALELLRFTSAFVKGSDKSRSSKETSGQTKASYVKAFMGKTTKLDANGHAIGASPGFAYITKQKFSKTKAGDAKTAVGVDGSLTGVLGAVQTSTNSIPGLNGAQCGVIQNPAFQIGVALVTIFVGVFSSGSSAAAEGGVELTTRQAITQALKASLSNILSRETAISLAKTLTVELSFEGVLAITQFFAEKSLTLNLSTQEQGAALGDALGGGAGALNKQRSLQAGMVPATTGQLVTAQTQYLADKKEEQSHQSFYTRVFDYDNQDSLAFQGMTYVATTPWSMEGLGMGVNNGLANAASLFTKPLAAFSGMMHIILPKASAQATDEVRFDTYTTKGYDNGTGGVNLATDPAGNLVPIMRTDIEAIDPIENIDYLTKSGDIDGQSLEPISENFKEHVANCVEAMDTLSTIEGQNKNDPKYDCLATQAITVRYKAHLAYTDMLDGYDAELFPEEIGLVKPAPVTGPVAGGGKADASVDTSALPCAGTVTGERVVTIAGGKQRKLCDYGDVRNVDASWSDAVNRMLSAANSAGVHLGPGNGFRDAAEQINLRRRNCGGEANIYNPNASCSPATALPGTSNHELGLAIDFGNMCFPGATCGGNPRYDWLAANAGTFGISKLSSEAWHWSVDGH
jgi:hypothetical protein